MNMRANRSHRTPMAANHFHRLGLSGEGSPVQAPASHRERKRQSFADMLSGSCEQCGILSKRVRRIQAYKSTKYSSNRKPSIHLTSEGLMMPDFAQCCEMLPLKELLATNSSHRLRNMPSKSGKGPLRLLLVRVSFDRLG
jgi:hypothetical protein